jgi:hypothetical protein
MGDKGGQYKQVRMTDLTDTFWLHSCGDRKVWTPIRVKCVLCKLTQKEAEEAWKKGTVWENK